MSKTVKIVAAAAIMIAVTVAAPGLAASALAAIGMKSAILTAVVATAITAAAAATLHAIGLVPKVGLPNTRNTSPIIYRQPLDDSCLLYGKRRTIYLKLVFYHRRTVGKRVFLYFAYVIAGHRCQAVTTWYLNDEIVTVDGSGSVTDGDYADAAWLWFARGLDTETANATFVAECDGKWTADHRGDGLAMIYAKFEMTDAVVEAGFATPSAVVEGKDDILDPRDGLEKYTNNATLVTYDWQRLPREEGGFGCWSNEIPDDDTLSAWANVCDEDVSKPGGGTEKRYALDAVIVTGGSPADLRDSFVINQAGSFAVVEGKQFIRPGYYVPPSETLYEENLAGPFTVKRYQPGNVTANRIEGSFINPDNNYQGAPFRRQQTAGVTDIRQVDLELAYITSPYRAERVASIALKRAEAELTVQWPSDLSALRVSTLDTVVFSTTKQGIGNYAFTLLDWSLGPDFSISLLGREENEEIYDSPSMTVYTSPSTVTPPAPIETDAETTAAILNSHIVEAGVLTAADVGATATITIGAHTRRYQDGAGDVAVNGGSLTGKAFATEYFVFYDDETRAGGAVTYGSTTTQTDSGPSPSNPFRHYVGRIRTPADGGAATTGTGGTAPWIGEEEADQIAFAPAGGIGATNVQAAIEEVYAERQPLDSDLTAIAALTTTGFGRGLLTLADAAALRTAAGLGTSAVQNQETGTFTPTLLFGGGSTGMTFSSRTGRYWRDGNQVICELRYVLTAKGSSTGTATLGGLPFTSNASLPNGVAAVRANNLTTVAVPTAVVDAGATTMALHDFSGSVLAVLTDADFTNTSNLILTVAYTAA